MDYGITLATSAQHWHAVKRAEEIGFTYAWFFDTPLLNAEVFVALAAAAMQTLKIKLCAGVLILSNRIAPVTASALASLNALAPGRIVFGVGTVRVPPKAPVPQGIVFRARHAGRCIEKLGNVTKDRLGI